MFLLDAVNALGVKGEYGSEVLRVVRKTSKAGAEEAGKGKPVFDIAERKLICGYGPRVLEPSSNGKSVFIGCKDGSITVIENLVDFGSWISGREQDEADKLNRPSVIAGTITDEGLAGARKLAAVRALCEVCEGFLLVGREDGSLDLASWKRPGANESKPEQPAFDSIRLEVDHPEGEKRGRVSVATLLGDCTLVVSWRGWGTHVWHLKPPPQKGAASTDVRHWLESPLRKEELSKEVSLCSLACATAVRTGQGSVPSSLAYLFVTEDGQAWWWKSSGDGNLKPLEAESGDPSTRAGLVLDRAAIKSLATVGGEAPGQNVSEGLYVPTDAGVFWVRFEAGSLGSNALAISPLSLPGLGQLCMSLTHHRGQSRELLWVFDAAGFVHLFWRASSKEEWARSGLRYEAAESVQVYVLPEMGATLLLVEARRKHGIVLTRFHDLTWPAESGEREFSLRRLLFEGTAADLKRAQARLPGWKTPQLSEWEPEWLLAALIERLGLGDEAERSILDDFLGAPTPHLAVDILLHLRSRNAGTFAKLLGACLGLWTDALIGTINRVPDFRARHRSLCLAVARWLVAVREVLEGQQVPKEVVHPACRAELEKVRRWAVFGPVSFPRHRVWSKIRTLSAQSEIEPENEALRDNLLRYQTLLLASSWDIEIERVVERSPNGGVRLATVQLTNGDTLAVASWSDLRVSIWTFGYGRVSSRNAEEDRRLLDLVPGKKGTIKHLAVLALGERTLLAFVAEVDADSPGGGAVEGIGVVELGLSQMKVGEVNYAPLSWWSVEDLAQLSSLSSESLPGSEFKRSSSAVPARVASSRVMRDQRLTCLATSPQGHLLLGLTGEINSIHFAVLSLAAVGGRHELSGVHCVELKLEVPISKGVKNSVLCISIVAESDLVLGCQDGRVMFLKRALALVEDSEQAKRLLECWQVGQLGGPVQRVAATLTGPALRVFAAAAGGTIRSWQMHRGIGGDHTGSIFQSLWATTEVSGEECLCLAGFEPHGPGSGGLEHLLVAVNRGGNILVLDNRRVFQFDSSQLGTSSDDSLRRIRVPGSRYLHKPLELQPGAVEVVSKSGSALQYPAGEVQGSSEPVVRLIVAGRAGELQVVTLHLLLHSAGRRSTLHALEERFRKDVLRIRPGDSAADEFQLRVSERLIAACSDFSLFLLRWIFRTEGKTVSGGPSNQYLPSIFQPLPIVVRWLRQEGVPGTEEGPRALKALLKGFTVARDETLLREALLEIALLLDRELLRRLVDKGPLGKRSLETFSAQLEAVMIAVEEALGDVVWQAKRATERLPVHFFKALANGSVLFALTKEMPGGSGAAVEVRASPVGRVFVIILEQLRRLVFGGSDLVTLEALRASGLAWSAMCYRGYVQSQSDWELPWPFVQRWVEILRDVVNAAGHSQGGISEPLFHEVSRCYALALLSCRSRAISIAYSVSETGVSQGELPAKICDQVFLLATLAMEGPRFLSADQEWPLWMRLFRAACTDLRELERFAPSVEPSAGYQPGQALLEGQRLCLNDARRFLVLARGVLAVARGLRQSPSSVDFGRLEADMESVAQASADWSHSKEYWQQAAARFKSLKLATPRRLLSPGLVAASRRLEGWVAESIEDLKVRKASGALFEPQVRLYRESLEELHAAAVQFPEGAAVQASLVDAVLSHGLIGELDEHVLELEEIAQALDPVLVERYRAAERDPELLVGGEGNIEAQFSSYLLSRARNAEAIPKNLRTLQQVLRSRLDPSAWTDGHSTASASLEVLESFAKEVLSDSRDLTRSRHWVLPRGERSLLRVVLEELAKNHRAHGNPAKKPVVLVLDESSSGVGSEREIRKGVRILCEAGGGVTKELRERLKYVESSQLQHPLTPNPNGRGPSHGTGLYLASLAASIAGWELTLIVKGVDSRSVGGPAVLEFVLSREAQSKEHKARVQRREVL